MSLFKDIKELYLLNKHSKAIWQDIIKKGLIIFKQIVNIFLNLKYQTNLGSLKTKGYERARHEKYENLC